MKLIDTLKENNQDFEWYPTTEEILKTIYNDLLKDSRFERNKSLLDIGAGNGKLFSCFDKYTEKRKKDNEYAYFHITDKYAIEKSAILCENLPADVVIVGTDFHQQTLIDKKVDIIFCNPPYSEYAVWVEKILKQGNCSHVYLVIPERWKEDRGISEIIKQRSLAFSVINSFTFENAEDRKARAKVDVIHFSMPSGSNSKGAFSIWFDENFKIDESTTEFSSSYHKETLKKTEELKNNIIKKENLIYVLEEFYLKDMENLLNSYKALEKVDGAILNELGVDIHSIKSGLQLKIEGLKNLYWKELFDNLDTITKRLCAKSRDELLKKLYANTHVDFTPDNAFAVILWVIKNVNNYIDKQMLDVYMDLSDSKNVINYKSNKKFVNDKWRYARQEVTHYQLDYRIVRQGRYALQGGGYGYSFEFKNNLHEDAHKKIQDICTVAETLGYSVKCDTFSRTWESNKGQVFYLNDGRVFTEVKAFKNGNLHFKFMPEFMKKFNIAVGKMTGWIKNEKEAFSEMSNISEKEIKEFWKVNWKISKKDAGNLLENRKAS